ncbi:unnamed protein product [Choristocarpus tenellus]
MPPLLGGLGPNSLLTGEGTPGVQDERRQKRLARNRESARQSRRRKKQYLELLEDKVAQLLYEIEGLRRMRLTDATNSLREAKQQQLAHMKNMLDAACVSALSKVEKPVHPMDTSSGPSPRIIHAFGGEIQPTNGDVAQTALPRQRDSNGMTKSSWNLSLKLGQGQSESGTQAVLTQQAPQHMDTGCKGRLQSSTMSTTVLRAGGGGNPESDLNTLDQGQNQHQDQTKVQAAINNVPAAPQQKAVLRGAGDDPMDIACTSGSESMVSDGAAIVQGVSPSGSSFTPLLQTFEDGRDRGHVQGQALGQGGQGQAETPISGPELSHQATKPIGNTDVTSSDVAVGKAVVGAQPNKEMCRTACQSVEGEGTAPLLPGSVCTQSKGHRGRDKNSGQGQNSWRDRVKEEKELETELEENLSCMLRYVGPNSKERQVVIGNQFDELERMVLPSYARFLLWLMSQGEEFFCKPGLKSGQYPGTSSSFPSLPPSVPGSGNSLPLLPGSGQQAVQHAPKPVLVQGLESSPGSVQGSGPVLITTQGQALGQGQGLGCGLTISSQLASKEDPALGAHGQGAQHGGEGGPSGLLWSQLCQELALSPHQESELRNHQRKARAEEQTALDCSRLGSLLEVLSELRVSTKECMVMSHQRMEHMVGLLGPLKMVDHLSWVSCNRDSILQVATAALMKPWKNQTCSTSGGAFVSSSNSSATVALHPSLLSMDASPSFSKGSSLPRVDPLSSSFGDGSFRGEEEQQEHRQEVRNSVFEGAVEHCGHQSSASGQPGGGVEGVGRGTGRDEEGKEMRVEVDNISVVGGKGVAQGAVGGKLGLNDVSKRTSFQKEVHGRMIDDKIMCLLAANDEDLGLEELRWMMRWVRSSRERRKLSSTLPKAPDVAPKVTTSVFAPISASVPSPAVGPDPSQCTIHSNSSMSDVTLN